MKKIFLTYLLIFTVSVVISQSSNMSKNLEIIDKELVIKSNHTYFKESFINCFLPKTNKMITIHVLYNLPYKYEIKNFRILIKDSLGKEKKIIHSYGNKLLDKNTERKKIKTTEKIKPQIKINNKGNILIIKFPIRYFSENVVSTFTEEYKLKKGKYTIMIQYDNGKKKFTSNKVPLIVK